MSENPSESGHGTGPCPSAVTSLGIGEVHTWLADLDHPPWPIAYLARSLSPDELRRTESFVFRQDQRRFIAARGLLRWLLAGYLDGEPGLLRLRYGNWGKPELATPSADPPLRFNCSRSHGLALYALTRGRRIGVDLEAIRDIPEADDIARQWFSPQEQATWKAAPPGQRPRTFLRVWTGKEAYAKAIGCGLSDDPQDLAPALADTGPPGHLDDDRAESAVTWSVTELHPAEGYVGALVVEGGEYQLSQRFFRTPRPARRPARGIRHDRCGCRPASHAD